MSLEALIAADFKTEPWLHQWREFERSCDAPERALLWQMRTGKTKLIIDTACHLFVTNQIDAVLIIAPNGVHANWVERELPIHMWDSVPWRGQRWLTKVGGIKAGNGLSAAARAGWAEERARWWLSFKAAVDKPRDLLIISFNSESMTRKDVRAAIAYLQSKMRVMVVFDESTDFRTPGSARTMMARSLVKRTPFRRILDGTAVLNSPLHAYSQYELLHKGALGFTTYEEFTDRYAEYEDVRGHGGRAIKKLITYRNLEELRLSMAKYSSVVLREDCVDLPLVVPYVRTFELTDWQKKLYVEVKEQIEAEVRQGEMVPIGVLQNKLNKLQQVTSGFLIDKGKLVHELDGVNPRLELLSDEVYLSSGKVIVWCQFQHEIDMVTERLRLDGWDIMEYHGRVSGEDKRSARTHFNTNGAKVLVGQPQAGARGIELSGADTIIWYSHTFDAIIRNQAKERATKMGGRNVSNIDLVADWDGKWTDYGREGGVDRYILGRVRDKITTGDFVGGKGLKTILESL